MRAILRAKIVKQLIINTYLARKIMKITSDYEQIYERIRKDKIYFESTGMDFTCATSTSMKPIFRNEEHPLDS